MSTVVTGMGAISAAGIGCQKTAERLFDVPALPAVVPWLNSQLSLPVFAVDLPQQTGKSRINLLLEFALDEAIAKSQLNLGHLQKAQTGICLGTTVACQLNDIDYYNQLRDGLQPDNTPLQRFVKGNLAEEIQRKMRLAGPALTVANACSSGTDAIAMGYNLIESGICDIVIAGGADELNRVPLAGFNALGVCGSVPCSPFDADRQGLNLGEGAGVVILESAAHAEARKWQAEFAVVGCGAATDAYHITAPHPDGIGLESAIKQALSDANLSSGDIDFINAHGTGTDSNDRCEANTLGQIFGKEVNYLSTKRFTGHTLGAAGALEFIFSAIMLGKGMVPASSGFKVLPDDIPFAPLTEPYLGDLSYAMSTSLAFGGCNSAIIIRKER